MESGQGVLDNLKEGLGSGKKRPWYAAIRAARALAEAGQLKDFNRLIYEAPCRLDPLFQWGICQLLGEVASDVVWDTAVRQHAVTLLVELYNNDQEWGQDESVKIWMLNIIAQISAGENQAVRISARTFIQELKQGQDTTTSFPYPLKHHLPLPSSSPILSGVQNIPFVEYNIYRLRVQRLKQSLHAVYIPPLATASLKAKDADLFPLLEKVQEFLASERQVMLVLGDSGAGKSTFNRHLEHLLWTNYKQGDPIPLFINLPGIREPDDDLVSKQLNGYNFKDDQIQELKLHHQFILICDGYDESQQLVNLHYTNNLNQPGQWNTKMIISCRTQFLGPTYLDRFRPQSNDRYVSGQQDLFRQAVIAPFSKQQIENYVEQYVPLEPRTWRMKDYMDRLTTIPNLLDLVRNPFLLTLALEALPGVTEGKKDLSKIKITRVQLYDTFVHHWLGVNQRRLERNNALSSDDKDILVQLMDADFVSLGIDYSSKLAQAIFDKQDGNPVVQYVHFSDKNTWKAEFFGSQPDVRLLRESSPLTRTGNQFRFVHRSMLEYFLSRVIYSPARIDNQDCDPQTDTMSSAATLIEANGLLFRRNLLQEPSVIQFLCDRVKSDSGFEQELRRVVNLSKTDSSVATAATNAITILVKAGALFNGADLRGIKIPSADLTDGQFDSVQLQGADLTGVTLSRSWLRQADLSGARLEDVRFGELPYLHTQGNARACVYSPDGRMLVVCVGKDGFIIYDTSTWTVIRQFAPDRTALSIAFSPDGQKIVSAEQYGALQMWDCTSGEDVLTMNGHTEGVRSVAFSPCGKQIASASDDGTVRLWDSQTGDSLFVWESHRGCVMSVKYSPDGRQLISGGDDGKIRFWNPQTGEVGVKSLYFIDAEEIFCLAYSPDGRWIASGHRRFLLLWNVYTGELGPILKGRSGCVRGIAFSPSGQWIISSGVDKTVRLLEAYSGTLLSAWTGYCDHVLCVAFSPDGLQVALGGSDWRVRLWEVGSASSGLEARGGGHIHKIAYSPDGRTILAQDSSRVLRKWDAGTGVSSESITLEFAVPKDTLCSCMTFTRDGSQYAVGYFGGSIRLWNRQASTAGRILNGQSMKVRQLFYSPCCRWIVSVDKDFPENYHSKDYIVRLWDLHNMEQRRVPVDMKVMTSNHVVVFSPTGDQLAVCDMVGTVSLFDLSSTELLPRNKLAVDQIESMVYSPNGRQIAIGTWDSCIYLWDLQSEKPGAKLGGHNGGVQCIAYSPCGQWIASGCTDKTVGIWHRQLVREVESWSRVHSICSFLEGFYDVAWNPFFHMEFVTGCEDGSIRVWRLSSDEGGNVVVKMLWGSNVGVLCTDGLAIENVTGLSSANQKLLVQHGAVTPFTDHKEQE